MPTPQDIVDKMLELAKVTSDDVVYDLGSGDGRIVITAAQKYGAHAVGVEINPDLYRQSSDRIKELGLDDRAHIMCEDMFDVSVHRATVVMLYLLTSFNEKLRPKLERELRSGARIVCHDFHIPGMGSRKGRRRDFQERDSPQALSLHSPVIIPCRWRKGTSRSSPSRRDRLA